MINVLVNFLLRYVTFPFFSFLASFLSLSLKYPFSFSLPPPPRQEDMIKWHMTHDTWGVPGGLGWGLPVRWGSAAALIALSAKVQSLLQPVSSAAEAGNGKGSSSSSSSSKKGKKGTRIDAGSGSTSDSNGLLLGQFPVLALHDPEDEVTQVRLQLKSRCCCEPLLISISLFLVVASLMLLLTIFTYIYTCSMLGPSSWWIVAARKVG